MLNRPAAIKTILNSLIDLTHQLMESEHKCTVITFTSMIRGSRCGVLLPPSIAIPRIGFTLVILTLNLTAGTEDDELDAAAAAAAVPATPAPPATEVLVNDDDVVAVLASAVDMAGSRGEGPWRGCGGRGGAAIASCCGVIVPPPLPPSVCCCCRLWWW